MTSLILVLSYIFVYRSSVNLEHNSLTSFGGLVNLMNLKVRLPYLIVIVII